MKSKVYVKCELGYWELEEENEKITALNFIGELVEHEKEMPININPILDEGKKQLEEYFHGQRQEFSLPLHLEGTTFQKGVESSSRDSLWDNKVLPRSSLKCWQHKFSASSWRG